MYSGNDWMIVVGANFRNNCGLTNSAMIYEEWAGNKPKRKNERMRISQINN